MSPRSIIRSAALLAVALSKSVGAAEEMEVGPAPVAVGKGPFYFDTAEQHDIRVDVLVRGLA